MAEGAGNVASGALDDAGPPDTSEARPTPTLAEATRVWAALGLLSFGGPAAQTALMHRMLVVDRGWLDERRFLSALGFCMLLPGPEAMQLATYAGWRLHGVVGGIVAGAWFVLPGAAIMLALGALYAYASDLALVSALFVGIKAAVLVIVVQALVRVAGRALTRTDHRVLAALAFVALFFLDAPYPLVVLLAAAYGALMPGADAAGTATPGAVPGAVATPASLAGTLRTVATWLVLWWLPIGALALLTGPGDPAAVLVDVGAFFSKLAVLSFGGAYAVLAWMAQEAVEGFGWLTAGEMMDGLGLAETTPGPLILVTEFVGFLAAFREGGPLLGIAGAAVTLWVTFVPCFLWIFAGAPWLDAISARPRLRGALAGITAAVVGVIANLSLWFALHVLFGAVEERRAGPVRLWVPDVSSVDWIAVGLAALAAVLTFGAKRSVPMTLAATAVAGLAVTALA